MRQRFGSASEIRSLDPRLDLTVFASEHRVDAGAETLSPPTPAPRRVIWWHALPAITAVSLVLTSVMWWIGPDRFGLGVARVRIESVPSGVAIAIDGTPRGATPLTVVLPIGAHIVDVGSGGNPEGTFEMRVEGGPQTYRLQLTGARVGAATEPVATVETRTP